MAYESIYGTKYGSQPSSSTKGYRRVFNDDGSYADENSAGAQEEERRRKREQEALANQQKAEQDKQAEEQRKKAEEEVKAKTAVPKYNSIWDRLGDTFTANSPQDIKKRENAGQTSKSKITLAEQAVQEQVKNQGITPKQAEEELAYQRKKLGSRANDLVESSSSYQDAKNKVKQDEAKVPNFALTPEELAQRKDYYARQGVDLERASKTHSDYLIVHKGLEESKGNGTIFGKKKNPLKDVDLKALAEKADKEKLFDNNQAAIDDLNAARQFDKQGSKMARTFYAQAIAKATPELDVKKLKEVESRFQESSKVAAGTDNNTAQQVVRRFSRGVSWLADLPSNAQTIGAEALDVVSPEGSRLDKYAQERYTDASKDNANVQQKKIDMGVGVAPNDNKIVSGLAEGAGSLASSMVLGGAMGTGKAAKEGATMFAKFKSFLDPRGVGALFGVNKGGEITREAKDAGKGDLQALATGVGAGYAEAVLENWGIGNLLGAKGSVTKQIFKQAFVEGSQEFMQDMATSAAMSTYKDVDWGQAFAQGLESGAYGAVLGGGASIATTTSNNLQEQGVSKEDADYMGEQYDNALRAKAVEKMKEQGIPVPEETAPPEDKSVVDIKPEESGPSTVPGANVTVPTDQTVTNSSVANPNPLITTDNAQDWEDNYAHLYEKAGQVEFNDNLTDAQVRAMEKKDQKARMDKAQKEATDRQVAIEQEFIDKWKNKVDYADSSEESLKQAKPAVKGTVKSIKEASRKASDIYKQVAELATDPKVKAQYQEQADMPNRYHTPEEAVNPKGIQIGDTVLVRDEKFGDKEGIAVSIQDESNAKAYKGGFSVNVVSPDNYGGFTEIDRVELVKKADSNTANQTKAPKKGAVKTIGKTKSAVVGTISAEEVKAVADSYTIGHPDSYITIHTNMVDAKPGEVVLFNGHRQAVVRTDKDGVFLVRLKDDNRPMMEKEKPKKGIIKSTDKKPQKLSKSKADATLKYPETKDLPKSLKDLPGSEQVANLKTVDGKTVEMTMDDTQGQKQWTILKREAIRIAKDKKDLNRLPEFRAIVTSGWGSTTDEQKSALKEYVLGDKNFKIGKDSFTEKTNPSSSVKEEDISRMTGTNPRKQFLADVVRTVPAIKESPVFTLIEHNDKLAIQFKDGKNNTIIYLTALGKTAEDMETIGIKVGQTIDVSSVLDKNNKGKVPVIRNNKTGVEAMVADEPSFKPRKQLPRRQVKTTPLEETTLSHKEAQQLEGLNAGIDMLSEAFDIPIRKGRMRMRQALGEHHSKEEIIRLRKIIGEGATEGGRLGVAAHEIGHNIAKNIPEFNIKKGVGIPILDKKGNADLSSISTKPNKAGLSGVYGEGFAEFMRYYVVNPESLVEKMPDTYKKIDDVLETKYPEIKKSLLRARNLWMTYQEAPATKKIMSQISYGEEKQSLGTRVREGLPSQYKKWVNDLYPMEQLEQRAKKEGVDIDPIDLPSTLAFLHRGVYGKAKAFMEYGTFGTDPYVYDAENKKYELKTNGKGFKEITQPIYNEGQEGEFDAYLVAKRTVSLAKQRNMQVGVTSTDAEASVAELDRKYPHFAGIQKELVGYNNRLLDYVIAEGMIEKSKADEFRQMNDNYVPFFRVLDAAGKKGFLGSGYADLSSGIKTMKGSEKQIISPLESIVKNTYALINAADANRVGKAWASLADQSKIVAREFEQIKVPQAKVASITLEQLGITEAQKALFSQDGITITEDADIEEVIDIFRPMFQDKSEQILTVMDKGKRKFYYVEDKVIYETILKMNEEQASFVGRMLSTPASWLRAGATLSPEFIGRNPIRDQWSAFVFSKTDYLPFWDMAKGMKEAVKKDSDYWMWQISGGPYATLVSVDRNYAKDEVKDITKGKMKYRWNNPNTRMDLIKEKANIITYLRNASELMENATRLGEYREAVKEHKSLGRLNRAMHPLEAAMASKEITLNFSRAGSYGRKVNQFAAFFNAPIQELDKIQREMRSHPYRTGIKGAVSITLPSLLLYFLNRDEEWYKETPSWEKDIFWMFKVGDTTVRIPKPFALGLIFGTIPERIVGELDNKGARDLGGLPKMIEGALPDPLPTALKPVLEAITNYSFFTGRPVDPRGEEKLDSSLKYGPYTSEFAKVMSDLTGSHISPRQIDNMVSGYFGGLGKYATSTVDKALKLSGRDTTPKIAGDPFTNIPLIKGFISRNPLGPSSESVTHFYSSLGRAETAEQTAKFLEEKLHDPKAAEQWRKDHPEHQLATSYRKFGKDLSDISASIKEIQRDKNKSSSQKKTEVDELNADMTFIAQQALRFDPTYNQGKEPLTPLPNQADTNDKINKLLGEGNTSEAYRISEQYTTDLNKFLDQFSNYYNEERRKKILEDNQIKLTPSSVRTRIKNHQ